MATVLLTGIVVWMMKTETTIHLEFTTPQWRKLMRSLSPNGRPHPMAKHTAQRKLKEAVSSRLRSLGLFDPEKPLYDTIKLQYHVLWCGRPPDRTNVIGSLKAAEDQIVREGVVTDDSPDHVLGHDVTYERVSHRNETGISISIMPL